MDIEIRTIEPSEFKEYMGSINRAFGRYPSEEDLEDWRAVIETDRSLAATEGGAIVGAASAVSFPLSVPGGDVPIAGVTGVSVLPTHRRRGILTSLMHRQLEDVHQRGEPIAGLWASESIIYGRFGYGPAADSIEVSIDRVRSGFARAYQSSGRLTMIEKDRALQLMPPIYERIRSGWPGLWGRSEPWWEHLHADREAWRDGASALFFVIHESEPGEPDGYVEYRVKHDWSSGDPSGTLTVRELMAESVEAYTALWRYCLDVDLMTRIEAWPRPAEEPLFHLLADPRQLRRRVFDGLWLRLVDVPASLARRRYAAQGRVVLEVRDAFCPWNEGRYELEGGPEGAQCGPTEREPDLVIEAGDLGACYLGGTRLQTLARTGRIHEERPGAVARAGEMFGWDPLPWCSAVF
jgi:predicted acetyltransferase